MSNVDSPTSRDWLIVAVLTGSFLGACLLIWGFAAPAQSGRVVSTTWLRTQTVQAWERSVASGWVRDITAAKHVDPEYGQGESAGAENIRNCRLAVASAHYELARERRILPAGSIGYDLATRCDYDTWTWVDGAVYAATGTAAQSRRGPRVQAGSLQKLRRREQDTVTVAYGNPEVSYTFSVEPAAYDRWTVGAAVTVRVRNFGGVVDAALEGT